MLDAVTRKRFEQLALAHLDAAYNLARHLTRNAQDAEDLVQEAYLRALQAFPRFQGGQGKAWILTIVRHTFYTWRRLRTLHEHDETFEEHRHAEVGSPEAPHRLADTPERAVLLQADLALLHQCLDALPVALREVLVLREFEGLSYQEIATIISVPKGTVMSRLARARQQLQQRLTQHLHKP
ncbi:MAG: sigma-70 family RNA polymerase sigma factor [Candidatus Tectimicrobiota bacterium]